MYVGKTSWFGAWMSCSLPSCCCSTWSSFDWLHIPFQLESVVVAVAAAPSSNSQCRIIHLKCRHGWGNTRTIFSEEAIFIISLQNVYLQSSDFITADDSLNKTLNVVYDIASTKRDYSAHEPHIKLKSSLGLKFSPSTCTLSRTKWYYEQKEATARWLRAFGVNSRSLFFSFHYTWIIPSKWIRIISQTDGICLTKVWHDGPQLHSKRV